MTSVLTPHLTAHWDQPDSFALAGYRRTGGYQALAKALALPPDEVIAMVKASGLRGRGGAGFPTGVKWGFIPQGDGKPHYLVVNADESEPGTCKDIPIMLANPHALVEGAIIAAYAIRASRAFIYVRGEVLHVVRRVHHAVAEAYQAGYLGENILHSGFDLEIVVHAGAGAYECGEETALLDSLEGFRGQPRLKPPFPAIAGLYACPTVVNNVESIASVPSIVSGGAEAFAALGTEKSKGFGIFSLSGHVTTPGQYEAPLGVTLRELLSLAGGVRAGHQLKFWTPGGSSTPIFTDEHLDTPLDFESVGAAGSMLGTRALQIFDETTCVVRATLRWMEFYQHESCGKCTPCREGTYWIVQLLESLEDGQGADSDLDKLLDICDNILGRAFCPFGDGAVSPVMSSIKYFRDEFIEHSKRGGCPFDPARSALFGASRGSSPEASTAGGSGGSSRANTAGGSRGSSPEASTVGGSAQAGS
jgi:NADH-quinone oxidoreductase subunit F